MTAPHRPLLPTRRPLVLAAAILTLLATLVVGGAVGVRGLESRLHPDLASLSETIGHDIADLTAYAVGAGIPLDRLIGVPDYFDSILAFDDRIVAILLRGPGDGPVLFQRGPAAAAAAAALAGAPAGLLTLPEGLAAPVPVRVDDRTIATVLVVLGPALDPSVLAALAERLALAGLGLAVLAALVLTLLLTLLRDRPGAAVNGLAAATLAGDLARRWDGTAPGALGRLLMAVQARRAALAARAHRLSLAAFAARAGHYAPAPLAAIDAAENQGLDGLHRTGLTDPPPLAVDETGLQRGAVASLLLAEALLLPLWAGLALPAPGGVAVLAALPLLALPVGWAVARRLLGGFARGLIFTAGAAVAAGGLLTLALAGAGDTVLAARLIGGFGYGLALSAALAGGRLTPAWPGPLWALAAGLPLGLALSGMLAAPLPPVLAAAILLAAGIVGGLTLPPAPAGREGGR